MISIILRLILFTILSLSLFSCQSKESTKEKRNAMNESKYEPGTFGYDLNFLKNHGDMIVLKDEYEQSQVIVSPMFQGKVFTSTAQGLNGTSYGWINFDLISSGKILEHMNGYGGEDRLWLGPEGGQYSIFFKPNSEMVIDNWYTPKDIDTEPFQLLSQTNSLVLMEKIMHLENYSGAKFNLKVERSIQLLKKDEIKHRLGISLDNGLQIVAFESKNTLINTGQSAWNKQSGTLCLWILGMFTPSSEATVIIPYVQGVEEKLGKIATTDYFGEIPPGRIGYDNGVVLFMADGKHRSKLGLSPLRAKNMAGSYDPEKKVLTIIQFTLPPVNDGYINQLWKVQDNPYDGDAVNSYNDGPLADGTQMGPFYELESSSPAAFLDPGEEMTHSHATFHIVGSKTQLSKISEKILSVSLDKVESIF
jgi:hypothetical protein